MFPVSMFCFKIFLGSKFLWAHILLYQTADNTVLHDDFVTNDQGPGRTSVKSCLFNKKICHHIGFARATDLVDIFKNDRNAPNVQRYRHLKLPSSGPRQNATKCQKSF